MRRLYHTMMRIAKIITGCGVALMAFGALFQFQGRGIVGPESSFMYYNKDWIHYGITMMIIGVMIVGAGVFALVRARLRAK